MEEGRRIRVVFKDDDILSETQKSGGLSRSWVLLKPHQHGTISDVASHLLHSFQLHQSCPHGLLLSISSFVLPPFESSSILKDDEIIRVQKRKDVLAIAGNNAANDVERLKAVEKQPVSSGLLLLANEEFEKEKGGYESDEHEEVEDDDEDGLLEYVENPSGSNEDRRNRKRKAADKLQRSKGKKQRSDATGSASNAVLTDKGEKDKSTAGECVEKNGEPAKLIDKSNVSGPSMKGTAEVQGNSKETDNAKIAPKETKKVPSRSARRKYAKRRWLREMAKIQKQNATCEPEGLRNWKEDQAKAGRKIVDGQVKGQQKWKKQQADADAVDGQGKGLLRWTSQDNWLVKGKKRKQRSQLDNFSNPANWKGDAHEQPTQNGDGHQQPNQKQGDSHEQPGQKNVVQECENQTCNASEQLHQESGEENEVVPVVIRPGHIRFEPLGEDAEQAVQKDHVRQETFQWNGITSKKKGQKWGTESRSFTARIDYKSLNKEYSEMLNNEKEKQADEGNKEKQVDEGNKEKQADEGNKEKQADEGNKEKQADERIDFDKLPPLLGMPETGDLIVYRILELSASWTPELSPYRVGKVSWYNAQSDRTVLLPVPEYPIISNKADEDEASQLDSSLYKKDGSLRTNFSSLFDVRKLNNGRSKPENAATSYVREGSVGDANASKTLLPSSSNEPTIVASQENVGQSIWDQLSETLNTKKEQLSKENGWGTTPNSKKAQHSEDNSWGKKPSPGNWEKAQDSSWGKQSTGSKSWSYKALRGSALGPTMSMLRSKKDT